MGTVRIVRQDRPPSRGQLGGDRPVIAAIAGQRVGVGLARGLQLASELRAQQPELGELLLQPRPRRVAALLGIDALVGGNRTIFSRGGVGLAATDRPDRSGIGVVFSW